MSRELDISPSVIRTWKRLAESGATTTVQASENVVPASQLRDAYAKIRELERILGRKTMEIEIQQAASNRRWCSDVFLVPCWSGESSPSPSPSTATIARSPAFVASPRSLTGTDFRTLMDRTLWARFGEATLKAPRRTRPRHAQPSRLSRADG